MTEPPTNIRALQSEAVLELTWDGGRVARLPYHSLRSECPCAVCHDEWTGRKILDPATIRPDLKVVELEPIGNYAVRIGWSDGHASGLYTWDALRRLSNEAPGPGDQAGA